MRNKNTQKQTKNSVMTAVSNYKMLVISWKLGNSKTENCSNNGANSLTWSKHYWSFQNGRKNRLLFIGKSRER